MPDITIETAAKIWTAHSEIVNGEKLLKEIGETRHDESVTPKDVFGRHHRNYEFGIPSGSSGHRMIGVTPTLAVYVVEAHIAEMRRKLSEACVLARMELDGVVAK